ncbi:GatB/YqeY domain-containing protein [Sulfurimonas sp. HSL-3221]|uniref:GatB/YqeY domain-containing protein n=1 Tax=Sulfurimonadaceae TaxID=2771471 RepID=UPI001E39C478|nr:GatB/YqeY domain-containing protein [Sulfurimonas sp. HSL-3221]UFS62050.1 GatB/YqeY domain-containing protein [Sulfurimonas sp. HSL-3221]
MELKDQIRNDIKEAMKAKEVQRRDALRLLNSAMKQIEVDERKELSDDDVIAIIQKQIKQRNDAAAQYKDAGRDELYDKEMAEIAVFETYLPAQLDDAELESAVKAIIEKTGASTMKDMGKVMGMASKELAGQADGKRISSCVKTLLS